MSPKFAAVAVISAVTSLAVAAPALADTVTPTPLSFDNLVLDTPATGDAAVVSPSTGPLAVTADLDSTTGDFTIDPSTFSAPTFTFTEPVSGSLSLALASSASGNENFATGAVTLTGDFLATITIPSLGGACTIDTGTLNLSTATTAPLDGVAFPAGPTGLASGDGALGAGWSSLAPGTGPACPTIDSFADNGAGGIWVSRGVSPTASTSDAGPAAPKVSATAAKPAAVERGAHANVKVTVTNAGGADSKSVKVCLAAKAPLVASKCQTVTDPGARVTKHLAFSVKVPATAKVGKHQLVLTATGVKAQTLTLTVSR